MGAYIMVFGVFAFAGGLFYTIAALLRALEQPQP